jgi:Zn-dependent protease with chaperone function
LKNYNINEKIDWVELNYSIVLFVLQYLWMFLKIFMGKKYLLLYRKKDEKFTNILRNVTKDEELNVYSLNINEPNAYYNGGKSFYYTTEIIKILNERELTAVLLHEYGHHKNNDYMKELYLMNLFPVFSIVFIQYMAENNLSRFLLKLVSDKIKSKIIDKIIRVTILRSQEKRADSYAVKSGYGKELAVALKKIDVEIAKILCPNVSYSQCTEMMKKATEYSEHPDTDTRIHSILKQIGLRKLIDNRMFNTAKKSLLGVIKSKEFKEQGCYSCGSSDKFMVEKFINKII